MKAIGKRGRRLLVTAMLALGSTAVIAPAAQAYSNQHWLVNGLVAYGSPAFGGGTWGRAASWVYHPPGVGGAGYRWSVSPLSYDMWGSTDNPHHYGAGSGSPANAGCYNGIAPVPPGGAYKTLNCWSTTP